eukprot:Clim_evm39s157 gene=Clim_evmTU39s157
MSSVIKATAGVRSHYSEIAGDMLERFSKALAKAGLTTSGLSPNDLAPIDEFHTRQKDATEELVDMLKTHVANKNFAELNWLDVGSGIGGPARHLAHALGCQVTGVDLTDDFTAVGNEMSQWCDMQDKVKLVTGDATNLSDTFPDSSFDGAWQLHVGMNIPTKDKVFQSVRKVLKPGGIFIIYDILARKSNLDQVRYPMPWATKGEFSFVESLDVYQTGLEAANFKVLEVHDRHEISLEFAHKMKAMAMNPDGTRKPLPPLCIGTLSEHMPTMIQNYTEAMTRGDLAPSILIAQAQN